MSKFGENYFDIYEKAKSEKILAYFYMKQCKSNINVAYFKMSYFEISE